MRSPRLTAAMPRRERDRPQGSLAHDRHQITRAPDLHFAGF